MRGVRVVVFARVALTILLRRATMRTATETEGTGMKKRLVAKAAALLVLLNLFCTLAIGQVAADSAPITGAALQFTDAGDILLQYVTRDGTAAKLVNGNQLYAFDVASNTITVEYTFPETVYNRDYSGGYIASQDTPHVYLDEAAGRLYYGYNEFTNTYAEDEIVHLLVYDLETAALVSEITLSGHILDCVGADKEGRLFVATDDRTRAGEESRELLVLSADGEELCRTTLAYAINEFSGFCDDGTFYYIDEYVAYSAYGYANLMGRLKKASFKDGALTMQETYIRYAKNIYFGDYSRCVELVDDTYLVTFDGLIIPLSGITDDSYSYVLQAVKDLEMGSEYDYVYGAGANTLIADDLVYTLSDNQTILVYSLSTGDKLQRYRAEHAIFNMKWLGNTLLLLETDGTNFYYEQVRLKDFEAVGTTTYDMNTFSVYRDRTAADIAKAFAEAAPADNEATLYAATGSGTAPYRESTLTDETKANAVNLSNYFRWLAGLTTFANAEEDAWTNAAKGAVLLSASEFSHTPAQPEDMDEAFYTAALTGTSSSSIAMNGYGNQKKLLVTLRQFMDDLSYTMPGHRNNFLTRNATDIAYGIFGGYVCQTVGYEGSPNPQGTAEQNNEAAYAWPAPGAFPAEELSTGAYWTVNLNTDKLSLSNQGLVVTIEDMDSGERWTRATAADGLESTSFWGRYISFAPPEIDENSYAGKRYRVTLTNLADADGLPAELSYTVEFFSYETTPFVLDGKTYRCDRFGQLTEIQDISDKTITLSYDKTTYSGIAQKPTVTIEGLVSGTDYTVSYADNIDVGTAQVTVQGVGRYAGTITATFVIEAADIAAETVRVFPPVVLYDGEEHRPSVTIADLTEGIDFTVTYPADVVSVGEKALVITGIGNYTGTAAATFRITEDASEVTGVLGDVNGDGVVNTTDARLTLQYAVGKIGEGDLDLSVADVNRSEAVDTTDARLILQKAVGKIEDFD